MATASGHFPSVALLSLFGLGSFVMRGAGRIINDLWDRDVDKKVEFCYATTIKMYSYIKWLSYR